MKINLIFVLIFLSFARYSQYSFGLKGGGSYCNLVANSEAKECGGFFFIIKYGNVLMYRIHQYNLECQSQLENLDERLLDEKAWEFFYPMLVAFQQRYGHCNVPYYLAQYRTLYSWACAQRELNAQRMLSPFRKRLLIQIGFTWRHQGEWENKLSELIAYKKKFDTIDIISSDPVYIKLKSWLIKQQKQPNTLSISRKKMLKKIGVDFENAERKFLSKKEKWEKTYRKLSKFFEIYGHSQVHLIEKGHYELRIWISRQRRNKDKLSREQIKRLDALHFVWDFPRPDNPANVRDETYLFASQILSSFEIPKSIIRTDVLRYLLLNPGQEATATQILNVLETRHHRVGMSAVQNTLRLFRVRGLVDEIKHNHLEEFIQGKGRPEIKFMCSSNLSLNTSTRKVGQTGR